MRVLVVNVGSSTIKLSVVSNGTRVAARTVAIGDGGIDASELAGAIDVLGPCDAVGHRVVHGGSLFRDPVVVDDDVRTQLAGLVSLAPLHLPRELACIDLVHRLVPQAPTVACFDTAFHATMPEEASTYALPSVWRSRWGLRRFGFHGLSHAWASSRAAELLDIPVESLRIVTCHLGAGASLAAVRSGVSVDTTMGFTPLEGLVMATRAGSVDPGLVLWLIQHAGVAPEEVADAMEHRSGLRALAGTGDMAAILEAEARGEDAARLAVKVYLHRLRAAVAAMAVSMAGLDALVFTGGVGENASEIRARAADGLGFLGIAVDPEHNRLPTLDADVSVDGSPCRTLVVAAREGRAAGQRTGASPRRLVTLGPKTLSVGASAPENGGMSEPFERTEDLDVVEITEDECLRLLATQDMGRLAVVRDGRPEIFPVNYGLDGGDIVFRTDAGTKFDLATMGWVAFEVDDFDPVSLKGWDVQARGVGRDVTSGLDAASTRLRAVEIVPWAVGEKANRVAILDPVLTGRRLVAGGKRREVATQGGSAP